MRNSIELLILYQFHANYYSCIIDNCPFHSFVSSNLNTASIVYCCQYFAFSE